MSLSLVNGRLPAGRGVIYKYSLGFMWLYKGPYSEPYKGPITGGPPIDMLLHGRMQLL